MGKRIDNVKKGLDLEKKYSLKDAVALVKKNANAKFDETVEVHLKLGVDVKQSDQQVRSTVSLPHGTGKTKKVAVIAKGEKEKEAQAAGADVCGGADLIEKIFGGFMEFDILVVTPDMMKDAAKLGKTLGPKGLMPNPKSGTVTFDVARAVKELKAGRIEFKADPQGIVHAVAGKVSFPEDKLAENVQSVIDAVIKVKPSSSKGVYIQSVFVSSSMGAGIPVTVEQKAQN
ncbi:MAG: 50S ribosomal protein L1 [Elusimicrobia bacterium RIFOXYA2_FULL_58_8]|nr:MAG: 50S ribosomal protein L1 [Elusimicrobia bacterium RIFOXYA12_FULL_57_11]OGS17282.1 MAG: 50S ribosomal protein L1 [Elusimicrobia bacterium RIFOXYA2_FULL_58_8]